MGGLHQETGPWLADWKQRMTGVRCFDGPSAVCQTWFSRSAIRITVGLTIVESWLNRAAARQKV